MPLGDSAPCVLPEHKPIPATWHPLWAALSVFQAPRVFQACCAPAWPPGPAAGSHSRAGHGTGSPGRAGPRSCPLSARSYFQASPGCCRVGREGRNLSHDCEDAAGRRRSLVSAFYSQPVIQHSKVDLPRRAASGAGDGSGVKHPHPPGRQVELAAPAQLKIPLGIASPSCQDVKPKWR